MDQTGGSSFIGDYAGHRQKMEEHHARVETHNKAHCALD